MLNTTSSVSVFSIPWESKPKSVNVAGGRGIQNIGVDTIEKKELKFQVSSWLNIRVGTKSAQEKGSLILEGRELNPASCIHMQVMGLYNKSQTQTPRTHAVGAGREHVRSKALQAQAE